MVCDEASVQALLKPGFTLHDGVFYYSPVPTDNPRPSKSSNATDKRRWSPWRWRNFDFFRTEFERLPRGTLLADTGAGQSDFRELYERFAVVPIDFYPFDLIRVVTDLNSDLPLKDHSVQAVMMSNVLEHIAEPANLLSECRRVLQPGGVLLGAVPFLLEVHLRPYDFYRYTDIGLTRLLERAGFEHVEVTPVVSNEALFRVASERFFGDLIDHYRRGTIAQRFLALLLRAHWKLFVLVFFKLGRAFARVESRSPNAALGYHFKAIA